MRTSTILLVIFAVGLLVTACSKAPTNTTPAGNTQLTADTAASADVAVSDDNLTNPDIGTLDDTAVSESVPQ